MLSQDEHNKSDCGTVRFLQITAWKEIKTRFDKVNKQNPHANCEYILYTEIVQDAYN